MTEYINRQDWAAAFEAVVPQRKYNQDQEVGEKKRIKLGHDQDGGNGFGDDVETGDVKEDEQGRFESHLNLGSEEEEEEDPNEKTKVLLDEEEALNTVTS